MTVTRPKIAFIDDEDRILRSLKMHFRATHDMFTTTDPDELLGYIQNNDVQVVISDQRMPKKLGVDVLKDVKEISPHTIRTLLTGYADLNAVVNSINEGEIFRYITKPWQTDELKNVVSQATQIAMQTKDIFKENLHIAHRSIAKRKVLVVDDSEIVYLQMQHQFSQFDISWANSLETAIELLENDRFGVAITDVSLGGENISPVIFSLKQQFPDLAVLVLISLNDSHTLIELIDKGQVYRYLPRPSNLSLLEISIQRAYDYQETLVNQPKLQIRHAVADVSEMETRSFGAKVKQFLSRFRLRTPSFV